MTGLGLVLWAIIEGPDRGWLSTSVLGAGLAGLAVMAAFVACEHHIDHPMLPLGFFRSRRFSVAVVAVALGVFAPLGGLFIQTQFLQFGLGYSPLAAGMCILPIAAVLAGGALTASRIIRLVGTRFTAAASLLLLTGGLVKLAAVSSITTTFPQVLPGMLLMALGAGVLLPTATDSVLGTLPRDDAGVGSSTNSTAIQVGGALGVAVLGSVVSTRYQDGSPRWPASHPGGRPPGHPRLALGALAVARIVGGTLGAALAHVARHGFALGSRSALLVAAGITGAGIVLVLAALPSRPSADSGERPGPEDPAAPGAYRDRQPAGGAGALPGPAGMTTGR